MTKIDESFSLNLRETELCLGLPGGTEGETALKSSGKRGFDETVDLKLGIIQSEEPLVDRIEKKMMNNNSTEEKNLLSCTKDPTKPPLKAQVVGWPPVRSFRKNIMSQKTSDCMNNSSEEKNDNSAATNTTTNNGSNSSNGRGGGFVKVSMDGAPYLRKVDLKMYNSYQQLSQASAQMFSSFTMGNYGTQGTIDFMIEGKLTDLLNSSEYVPTYEDGDSDWMLVGDVPWQMFVDSCKRLRIMKGSEAIGLAPRAMEKCKSRS